MVWCMGRLGADSEVEVRNASVNIIPSITKLVPVELKGELVKLFSEFNKDKSKLVIKSSLLQLGDFICSLEGREIPKTLLELYASLADSKVTSDEEVKCRCAATFPKVFALVGMKAWPLLRPMFKSLIKKKNQEVKESMMTSIHKIAQIMDTPIAIEMLDPLVKKYLSNKNRVNICLLNLHEFLKILNEPQRSSYLGIVKAILEKSAFDWRKREIIAAHLGDYARLFNSQVVRDSVLPMACGLVQDTVVQVRQKACKQFIEVINRFRHEEEYAREAFGFVLKLAASINYKERQSFLLICESCMSDVHLFKEYLLTPFLSLQKDKVVNVRVTLARILHAHISSSAELAGDIHIGKLADLLKEDKVKEVREIMQKKSTKGLTDEELKEKQELLERMQRMAAEDLGQAAGDDEELEEEARRRETATLIKNTIRVDEVDDKAKLT